MPDFKEKFEKVIIPKLKKDLGIENIMAVPRFKKIVVNVGIGSKMKDSKDFSDVVENVRAITGQSPVVQKSKKSISNFKLRLGVPAGVKATVRGARMYSLLDRLINVALPRIRDFQGLPEKSIDRNGSYSIGLRDCSVFPEINPDDIAKVHGIELTIVTSAREREHTKALLKACNFPLRQVEEKKKKEETKS